MADSPSNSEAVTLYNNKWYNETSAQTQVNVVGIADKALNGIYDAIHRTAEGINTLTETIEDQHGDDEQERKRGAVSSIAADKRNRAVNNAIQGKLSKGLDIMDLVKATLGRLLNLVKDNFIKALKKYDEFSANMRRLRISPADKKDAQLKADQAYLKAREMGLSLTKDDITSFSIAVAGQPEFKSLSDTQLAIAAQLKATGMSDEKILTALRTAGNSPEAIDNLKLIALRLLDIKDNGATKDVFEQLIGDVRFNSIVLEKYGGDASKAMLELQTGARELVAASGNMLSGKDVASLISTQALVENGRLQGVSDSEILGLLAAAKESAFDGGKSLSDYIKSQQGKDKAYYQQMLRELEALRGVDGIDQELLSHLSTMYTAMGNKSFTSGEVTTDETLKGLSESNAKEEGGSIERFMQSLTSELNIVTGGLIGSTSDTINALFGSSLSLSEIASTGFSKVIEILRQIQLGQFGSGLMKGGTGGAIGKGLIKALAAAGPFLAIAFGTALGIGTAVHLINEHFSSKERERKLLNEDNKEKNDKIQEQIDDAKARLEENRRSGNTRDANYNYSTMMAGEAQKWENNLNTFIQTTQYEDIIKKHLDFYVDNFLKASKESRESYTAATGVKDDEVIAESLKKEEEIKKAVEIFNKKVDKFHFGQYTMVEALKEAREELKKSNEKNKDSSDGEPDVQFATGGAVNSPTRILAGEKGREIIFPITNKLAVKNVLKLLTDEEKKTLLESMAEGNTSEAAITSTLNSILDKRHVSTLLPKDIGPLAPGDDQASLDKILSYTANEEERNYVYDSIMYGRKKGGKLVYSTPKGPQIRLEWYKEAIANAANQQGRDLIRGTYAEKALDWGITQLGKPYILQSLGRLGYVCNELTNAALRKSGYDMKDFAIHSVGTTFSNISKGKMVNHYDKKKKRNIEYPEFKLRPDITKDTALPGMLFFQDSNTKDGVFSPTHVGLVYYGNQILHSAGGSGGYKENTFLPLWQTPCRGVTVTPFKSDADYQFAEIPGLFLKPNGDTSPAAETLSAFNPSSEDSSTVKATSESPAVKAVYESAADKQKRMAKQAMEAISSSYSGSQKQILDAYLKQAHELIDSKHTVKEVVEAMAIIIKYLKDIASSPANKKSNPVIQKLMPTVFK